MSFFKRRPIVDERDSDGDNDGNIDPELRLRTVRTAASALEVSVKTEQRAERRKSRRFFSRKKKKDAQATPNHPAGPRRNVYVNYPLSAMEVDRDGEPKVRYVRNKVRTTKYTIFTFIPKNLYEQFRRVANLFFLTLVILQLFPIFGAATGAIAVMPLAFILTVTAIKDGIEDYSRGVLDEEVNNSAATKLDGGWRNVNQPTDPRSFWEKLLGLNAPGKVTRGVRKLRDREAGQARIVLNRGDHDEDSSVLTHDMSQSSMDLTKGAKGDGVRSVDSHNYPPTSIDTSKTSISEPSQWGGVGPLSQYQDSVRSHGTATGVMNWGKRTAGTARWERTLWKKLEVGDIVLLRDNDQVPADIIVLATSDPDGMCYLETKNLDGETNLKPRKALRATWSLASEEDIERSSFYVDSEPPHQNLYQYHGVLRYNHPQSGEVQQEPISINELLLRGCILRNTSWIIGLVMFTGSDTKIMLNGGDTPSKRSKIEKETNFNVIVNFVLLAILCIITAIFSGLADAEPETSAALFEEGSEPTSSYVVNAIITFVSCLILLQNIIPISLYISIEIVKTIQAFFISQDIDMYYAPYDTPCVPKTWNISDDLGQIEYIFSDKTGTLTQNIMEFQRCSINGVAYGEGVTEAQRGAAMREGKADAEDPEELNRKLATLKQQMVSAMERGFKNRYTQTDKLTLISPKFAQDLTDTSGKQRDHIVAFFRALALCHTVLSDKPDPQTKPYHLDYKAESPDEAALVAAAREVGFPFIHKSKDLFQIEVMGQEERWTLLKMLEFNSTRKRMSVLMRRADGRIILYCKGADSVIYERLAKDHDEFIKEQTRKDMETFANSGLRTLCIAYREVTEEEYATWVKAYDAATNAIEDREEAIDQANALMEHSLFILGATALEDKLQEGVPEAIELLHRAGIKLWILTGDKLQTAIEIGYSCNLLKSNMDLMILSADSHEQARSQIEAGLNKIASVLGPPSTNPRMRGFIPGKQASFAVVIDGDTLRHALTPELKEMFLNLGTQCETVVCCRVSPAQKALTVNLVKEGRNAMTLSIGDGANDVAMIQEANIGCGLFGLEGSQAAMSADYAFGQFRFLTKLLLVHGGWSYRRVAEMHCNFFYKNVIWTLALFWYLPFNSFQATYLYQYTFILLCNLVFTSLPVIVLGAFDQDINAKAAMAFPQLYVRGIRGLEYTRSKFWWYMFDGLYQSAVVFFIPYLSWVFGSPVSWTGRTIESISDFGTTVAVSAIVAANTYVGMNTNYWTAMTWIVVIGSTVVMWIWVVVYSFFPSIDFIDEAQILFGTVSFWTTVLLTVLACLAPRYIYKYITANYFPLDRELIREMWVEGDLKDQLGLGHRKKRGTMASHSSSASSLEAAPMIYEPHHETSSEMALNEMRPNKRESYQHNPSMSEANAQYIQAPPASDALLSPSRAYNNDRDRKNNVISPSPSYYSASDLPPSSPLPSPKYKYSTGEVTSIPPPPSRRASAASRAPSRRSPPPGPVPTSPLPPQPATSTTPTTPNYPQAPPPSSYLQTNNSRPHLRAPSATSSYGHGFERSGSSASFASHAESYATAHDEFSDMEPPTPRQQQAYGSQQHSPSSNNPYYQVQHGGETDEAYGGMAQGAQFASTAQQPLAGGRQLQEPPKGPYPHHGHPRNEPTDQWDGPTAM